MATGKIVEGDNVLLRGGARVDDDGDRFTVRIKGYGIPVTLDRSNVDLDETAPPIPRRRKRPFDKADCEGGGGGKEGHRSYRLEEGRASRGVSTSTATSRSRVRSNGEIVTPSTRRLLSNLIHRAVFGGLVRSPAEQS